MIFVFDLHHQLGFTCDSLSICVIYLCRIISKGINKWESYRSDTTILLCLYHDLWYRSLTVDKTLLVHDTTFSNYTFTQSYCRSRTAVYTINKIFTKLPFLIVMTLIFGLLNWLSSTTRPSTCSCAIDIDIRNNQTIFMVSMFEE
jgi:hypothetical protein